MNEEWTAGAHAPKPRGFNRDYYGGALLILLGLYAVAAGRQYSVGTLSAMGPGFFPVVLGVLMALLGVIVAIQGARGGQASRGSVAAMQWRGWGCIVLSIVAFVVIARYGGFVPATFAIVFISALGDRRNSVRDAALLAAAICVVCVVVFWWALQLQFPLFAWG
ncbi:tripartite tricarboxylate transporter TctB family protein [Paraburkholderia sp. ZP32-5]|uniref:tripartite tricarboxylate transporter TctB family protein n=1 Tax=Paraburkholderia sp. ZP32-5 TaxID=2883245 RepID=UPI001F290C42|nr:tripartite tricarboxylate transporter TctB family protein [Paraburkholderia sp. ZP32-5]